MSLGNLAARDLLRRVVGKTGEYVAPANMFVALSSTDPAEDGQSITEPSTGGYARQSTVEANWNDPTLADPSLMDNGAAITWLQATADYLAGVDLTHFALWRSLAGTTEADYVWGGPLTTAKPILDGDTGSFAIGDLNLTLA